MGVNLISSTPADASGKEVTSADFIQSNLLNYTTNRILEIPQDIKAELNNGVITVKAGTKVYIPNGFEADGTTPKFDVVSITADTAIPGNPYNVSTLVTYNDDAKGFPVLYVNQWYDGDTEPTNLPSPEASSYFWYDTKTNLLKFRASGASSQFVAYRLALPILLATSTVANGYASIDQVFNGFEYIGSTIFVLPGVKCLIGNGRNADGTPITKIEESTNVSTFVMDVNRTNQKVVLYKNKVGARAYLYFDEQANMCYNEATNQGYQPTAILGTFSTATTSPWNITEFNPMGVDSFANSNASNFSKAGESYLSSLSMPSGKYIDLTLGASGTTYTAPANGWFLCDYVVSGLGSWIVLEVKASKSKVENRTSVTNQEVCSMLPVKAGDVMLLGLDSSATYTKKTHTNGFVFIYAEGDQ